MPPLPGDKPTPSIPKPGAAGTKTTAIPRPAAPGGSPAAPSGAKTTGSIPKPAAPPGTKTGPIPNPAAAPGAKTTGVIPKPAAPPGTKTGVIPKPAAPPGAKTTGLIPKPGASPGTKTGPIPRPAAPPGTKTGPIPKPATTAIPQQAPAAGKTTGVIVRPDAATPKPGTAPARTGSTGRVPLAAAGGTSTSRLRAKATGGSATSTGRLGRGSRTLRAGGSGSIGQRWKLQAARSRNKILAILAIGAALAVVAGIVAFMSKGDGKVPEEVINEMNNRLADAYALYEQKKFSEADAKVHLNLAVKEAREEEVYKRTEVFDRDLHPLAIAEAEARKVVPDWLKRVEEFLANPTPPEAGAALFDEGEKLQEKYPNCSYRESIDENMEKLVRYKARQSADDWFARYHDEAEKARKKRRSRDYADALQIWADFKGSTTNATATGKANDRIREVNDEAKSWVATKLSRQAEVQRDEGKVAEGLKLLEDARPKVKGTEAEATLEEQIKAYQAKAGSK